MSRRKQKIKKDRYIPRANLSPTGGEINDGRSMAIPSGFKRPETLQEQIRRLVRSDPTLFRQDDDDESFEEADDFDVEDDIEVTSPFEMFFDPTVGRDVSAQFFHDNEKQIRAAYQRQQQQRLREAERDRFLEEVPARRGRGASPPERSDAMESKTPEKSS